MSSCCYTGVDGACDKGDSCIREPNCSTFMPDIKTRAVDLH